MKLVRLLCIGWDLHVFAAIKLFLYIYLLLRGRLVPRRYIVCFHIKIDRDITTLPIHRGQRCGLSWIYHTGGIYFFAAELASV